MYGIINYDDIVHGMVTIFQVITLEGWSTLMYNLSDTSP
jgi:ketol-acid reductoisomerase